jgi:hypothetical protein
MAVAGLELLLHQTQRRAVLAAVRWLAMAGLVERRGATSNARYLAAGATS